jgi:hypothetical protein
MNKEKTFSCIFLRSLQKWIIFPFIARSSLFRLLPLLCFKQCQNQFRHKTFVPTVFIIWEAYSWLMLHSFWRKAARIMKTCVCGHLQLKLTHMAMLAVEALRVHSAVQLVLLYNSFCCTTPSAVQLVLLYNPFCCTTRSAVQLVLLYNSFCCTTRSAVQLILLYYRHLIQNNFLKFQL